MNRSVVSSVAPASLIAAGIIVALAAATLYAPREVTMGEAQRIVYLHVPVAWLGLLGILVMAGCGLGYLATRDMTWDHGLQAAGEVGWLCCTLTLVTGALWAREAWGTWWEWDPRLTAALVLWLIYSGTLLVRSGIEDAGRRARICAALAVLGTIDVPLVVMATRWFRGLHPVAPQMDPAMRTALMIGAVAWTVFFVWLARRRHAQLKLCAAVSQLEQHANETLTVVSFSPRT